MNGYFYISRSGVWVKKFKYVKHSDGLWHITESYTTDIEKGRDVLAEIFVYGYFEPRIWDKEEIIKFYKIYNANEDK